MMQLEQNMSAMIGADGADMGNSGAMLSLARRLGHVAELQSNPGRQSAGGVARTGFTLIEMVIVVAVIAILVSLLTPAVLAVRTNAKKQSARAVATSILNACEVYANEYKSYPPELNDLGSYSSVDRGMVALLENYGFTQSNVKLDSSDRLLDPWSMPFRYSLTRPTPSAGTDRLQDWNWDAQTNQVARRAQKRDPATGLPEVDGSGDPVISPLAYPYVWSLGPDGTIDDASTWLFKEDG